MRRQRKEVDRVCKCSWPYSEFDRQSARLSDCGAPAQSELTLRLAADSRHAQIIVKVRTTHAIRPRVRLSAIHQLLRTCNDNPHQSATVTLQEQKAWDTLARPVIGWDAEPTSVLAHWLSIPHAQLERLTEYGILDLYLVAAPHRLKEDHREKEQKRSTACVWLKRARTSRKARVTQLKREFPELVQHWANLDDPCRNVIHHMFPDGCTVILCEPDRSGLHSTLLELTRERSHVRWSSLLEAWGKRTDDIRPFVLEEIDRVGQMDQAYGRLQSYQAMVDEPASATEIWDMCRGLASCANRYELDERLRTQLAPEIRAQYTVMSTSSLCQMLSSTRWIVEDCISTSTAQFWYTPRGARFQYPGSMSRSIHHLFPIPMRPEPAADALTRRGIHYYSREEQACRVDNQLRQQLRHVHPHITKMLVYQEDFKSEATECTGAQQMQGILRLLPPHSVWALIRCAAHTATLWSVSNNCIFTAQSYTCACGTHPVHWVQAYTCGNSTLFVGSTVPPVPVSVPLEPECTPTADYMDWVRSRETGLAAPLALPDMSRMTMSLDWLYHYLSRSAPKADSKEAKGDLKDDTLMPADWTYSEPTDKFTGGRQQRMDCVHICFLFWLNHAAHVSRHLFRDYRVCPSEVVNRVSNPTRWTHVYHRMSRSKPYDYVLSLSQKETLVDMMRRYWAPLQVYANRHAADLLDRDPVPSTVDTVDYTNVTSLVAACLPCFPTLCQNAWSMMVRADMLPYSAWNKSFATVMVDTTPQSFASTWLQVLREMAGIPAPEDCQFGSLIQWLSVWLNPAVLVQSCPLVCSAEPPVQTDGKTPVIDALTQSTCAYGAACPRHRHAVNQPPCEIKYMSAIAQPNAAKDVVPYLTQQTCPVPEGVRLADTPYRAMGWSERPLTKPEFEQLRWSSTHFLSRPCHDDIAVPPPFVSDQFETQVHSLADEDILSCFIYSFQQTTVDPIGTIRNPRCAHSRIFPRCSRLGIAPPDGKTHAAFMALLQFFVDRHIVYPMWDASQYARVHTEFTFANEEVFLSLAPMMERSVLYTIIHMLCRVRDWHAPTCIVDPWLRVAARGTPASIIHLFDRARENLEHRNALFFVLSAFHESVVAVIRQLSEGRLAIMFAPPARIYAAAPVVHAMWNHLCLAWFLGCHVARPASRLDGASSSPGLPTYIVTQRMAALWHDMARDTVEYMSHFPLTDQPCRLANEGFKMVHTFAAVHEGSERRIWNLRHYMDQWRCGQRSPISEFRSDEPFWSTVAIFPLARTIMQLSKDRPPFHQPLVRNEAERLKTADDLAASARRLEERLTQNIPTKGLDNVLTQPDSVDSGIVRAMMRREAAATPPDLAFHYHVHPQLWASLAQLTRLAAATSDPGTLIVLPRHTDFKAWFQALTIPSGCIWISHTDKVLSRLTIQSSFNPLSESTLKWDSIVVRDRTGRNGITDSLVMMPHSRPFAVLIDIDTLELIHKSGGDAFQAWQRRIWNRMWGRIIVGHPLAFMLPAVRTLHAHFTWVLQSVRVAVDRNQTYHMTRIRQDHAPLAAQVRRHRMCLSCLRDRILQHHDARAFALVHVMVLRWNALGEWRSAMPCYWGDIVTWQRAMLRVGFSHEQICDLFFSCWLYRQVQVPPNVADAVTARRRRDTDTERRKREAKGAASEQRRWDICCQELQDVPARSMPDRERAATCNYETATKRGQLPPISPSAPVRQWFDYAIRRRCWIRIADSCYDQQFARDSRIVALINFICRRTKDDEINHAPIPSCSATSEAQTLTSQLIWATQSGQIELKTTQRTVHGQAQRKEVTEGTMMPPPNPDADHAVDLMAFQLTLQQTRELAAQTWTRGSATAAVGTNHHVMLHVITREEHRQMEMKRIEEEQKKLAAIPGPSMVQRGRKKAVKAARDMEAKVQRAERSNSKTQVAWDLMNGYRLMWTLDYDALEVQCQELLESWSMPYALSRFLWVVSDAYSVDIASQLRDNHTDCGHSAIPLLTSGGEAPFVLYTYHTDRPCARTIPDTGRIYLCIVTDRPGEWPTKRVLDYVQFHTGWDRLPALHISFAS